MALTKAGFTASTDAAYIASQSVAAGATLNGSAFDGGYGFSLLAVVTNGGTAPAAGASVSLQGSADGSTWVTLETRTAGLTASTAYRLEFARGVAGGGGEWPNYRLQVAGDSAQAVTVKADGARATAL